MHSLDAEASTDNLLGSSQGGFSCAASDPSSAVVEIRISYATYTAFLVFVFTTLPASSFLAVNAQIGRFIIDKLQCIKAPILPPLYLFQRPFPNLQPTCLRRQGYLEAEFDITDLLSQRPR